MKKPDDPRHAIKLAEECLKSADGGRVDISANLLRAIIALARAWTFTRSKAEAAKALDDQGTT